MILDATGDMRTDLLGMSSESNSKPQLWSNTWDESNSTSVFNVCAQLPFFALSALQLTSPSFDSTSPPVDLKNFDCKFPSPHFNAFIDLDGDCLADLFLTCEGKSAEHLSYQIWLNNKDGNFTLSRKGDLPRGTKSVSFADMGEFWRSAFVSPRRPFLPSSRSRWNNRHGHHIMLFSRRLRSLHCL